MTDNKAPQKAQDDIRKRLGHIASDEELAADFAAFRFWPSKRLFDAYVVLEGRCKSTEVWWQRTIVMMTILLLSVFWVLWVREGEETYVAIAHRKSALSAILIAPLGAYALTLRDIKKKIRKYLSQTITSKEVNDDRS